MPPERYGGTERVVSTLTEELVRRGYQITLVDRPLWELQPWLADCAGARPNPGSKLCRLEAGNATEQPGPPNLCPGRQVGCKGL